MNFLTLVLLLMFTAGCFSEVVNNYFEKCRSFFANPKDTWSPPTIFTEDHYKQICQIRDNTYEYATLYDTANKIPVYSAYKFEGYKNCTRNDTWYIEPQLDNPNAERQMKKENNLIPSPNQASNHDYKKSGYDKGHLAPVYHASSQNCADATFTLTNAAPQNLNFNRGQWRKTEKYIADTLQQKCIGYQNYIVTGVVPGGRKLKNRVNVPSYFWTAYCCLDNNLRVKALSGFLGDNIAKIPVKEMSVSQLDGNLTELYGKPFQVFRGRCNNITSRRRFVMKNKYKYVLTNRRREMSWAS